MNFLEQLKADTKNIQKKVIYPEVTDKRIIEAVKILASEWQFPVLCGKQSELEASFGSDLEKYEYIVCPDEEENGFYAAKMLAEWKVDWYVAWAEYTTGHTLKCLFKNVGMAPWVKRMSGYFLMNTPLGLKIFADCAVLPCPTAEQLAEIAYLSIKSARLFGIKPKVAMLSFSTKWSASTPETQKVIEATALIKARLEAEWITDVELEWELQLDAAIDENVAKSKVKDWSWSGGANVLIFPSLEAGNIGYKLVQYFSGSQAVWPVLQGLAKPGNDLSRGCSVDDILVLHAVTLLQISQS